MKYSNIIEEFTEITGTWQV